MPPQPPPLGPGNGEKILLTLGPDFFGIIWNWFLLGTLLVQVYYYFLNFKRDPIWLRLFVYSVFILDLIQTGLSTATAYYTFARHWGNVVVFSRPLKTIICIPLFAGFIAMVIQIFYAWRIWTLGKVIANKTLVAGVSILIIMLALLQGITAMIGSFLFLIYDLSFDLEPHSAAIKINRSYLIWLSTSFTCDAVIAIVMVYILTTAKTATFFKRTNDIISRLIVIAIASGAATAVCTLVDLTTFLTLPSTGLIETPAYVVGKLFSNSFLVNLNSRRRSEDSLHTVDMSTTDHSSGLTNNIGTGLRFADNSLSKPSRNGKKSKVMSEMTSTEQSGTMSMSTTDRSRNDASDFAVSTDPGFFRVAHPPRPSGDFLDSPSSGSTSSKVDVEKRASSEH